MSDGDAGQIAAGISVTGIVIIFQLALIELFIENTTEDMRLGMIFVGIAMFLCGAFIVWLTEP